MKQKYYSLTEIDRKNCQYSMIIGQRSNGKTFAALSKILKNYCETKKQGVILRRFDRDFIGNRGAQMFAAIASAGLVDKYTGGVWTGVYYYGGRWFLSRTKAGKRITDTTPFCFGLALSQMEHDKSTAYPDVTTIVFDEFLTRSYYLEDEFVIFQNALSTIIRDRTDVKIYMLGNTVSKSCPYFHEMGLTGVEKQKQGTIDVYTYGDTGLRVAVEYCAERKSITGSDTYFAFNNPRLKMISKGTWEIDVYPHLPVRYAPKDVLFTYYVDYGGHLLRADIILHQKSYFCYITPKTTPLKDLPEDLIYSDKSDPRPNWHRSLMRGTAPIDAKLRKFIADGQMYYADNETGELMRSYLMWATKNT